MLKISFPYVSLKLANLGYVNKWNAKSSLLHTFNIVMLFDWFLYLLKEKIV
jgi:hypothetical protein